MNDMGEQIPGRNNPIYQKMLRADWLKSSLTNNLGVLLDTKLITSQQNVLLEQRWPTATGITYIKLKSILYYQYPDTTSIHLARCKHQKF